MLFRKSDKTPEKPAHAESLEAVIQRELGDADGAVTAIVTAIAGLLASVAYADREIASAEAELLKRELGRIQGLDQRAVQAIYATLTRHVLEISTLQRPRYTRALVEHADRDLRVQVLEALVELAAADGTINHAEVSMLRTLTSALGLSQDDYNELQARHRHKLGTLR